MQALTWLSCVETNAYDKFRWISLNIAEYWYNSSKAWL